ncbi:hypothetical protein IFM89_026340 [Coptis chinensis]|uniref:Apple domain-containing protein n=1 Tax=Coptis chinensis TaxID=261450 RepID=A0A835HK48_9MAGN|nr:hypothetical protein IFM89_026340 [Coptis chinensis]
MEWQHNQCGAYGICDPNKSPVCKCTKGFEPKNLWDWKLGDGSSGCVREKKFECGKDDGFLEMKRMKLPDTLKTFVDLNMNLKECKEMCETNCSCTDFTQIPILEMEVVVALLDLREYIEGGEEDLCRGPNIELRYVLWEAFRLGIVF